MEHLYEAVAIGKASAVLAASIFHFGQIRISEAKAYLKSKGMNTKVSWRINTHLIETKGSRTLGRRGKQEKI